jgi:hypothetical protein
MNDACLGVREGTKTLLLSFDAASTLAVPAAQIWFHVALKISAGVVTPYINGGVHRVAVFGPLALRSPLRSSSLTDTLPACSSFAVSVADTAASVTRTLATSLSTFEINGRVAWA